MDIEIDTIRLSRPSLPQVKAVVEFIQKHPILAYRGFRNRASNERVQKLWVELANKVNAIHGAAKTTKGWIKFWLDKRRNTILKQKQINSGELVAKITNLEKKILHIASTTIKKNISLGNKKPQGSQLYNGDDNSLDDNLKEEIDPIGPPSLPSESDEQHLSIMEKMIDAMDQQATALAKMAQATLIKSKAMERLAEASHDQALAVDRLAGTFETIDSTVYDVRNAVISIDYTVKKCFSTSSAEHRQNNLFS